MGIGLVIPNSLEDGGVYDKVGFESSFIFNKLLLYIDVTLGPTVGENRYGSGGLSNNHSLIGSTIGYITTYKKIAISPLIGFCVDNTHYNDAYYGKTVGETKTYFDYGGSIMYTHKKIMYSLKITKCFPIGLSVSYVFI